MRTMFGLDCIEKAFIVCIQHGQLRKLIRNVVEEKYREKHCHSKWPKWSFETALIESLKQN